MLTAVAFIIMQFQERNLDERNLDERNKAQRLDESMQQFQQQLRVEKSMQQQFDNIQKKLTKYLIYKLNKCRLLLSYKNRLVN
jgi:hypothetical protein